MVPKLWKYRKILGRRAFSIGRSRVVRLYGQLRSDYVDISNDKMSENLIRRKPKVFWVKVIFPELVGP